MEVSVGFNIRSHELTKTTLGEIVHQIKYDLTLEAKIHACQEILCKEERRQYKTDNLPYFCPGIFYENIRRQDNLQEICAVILDIDNLAQHEAQELKNTLHENPEIRLAFVSPSGRGLKVMISLDREVTDPCHYKTVFQRCAKKFAEEYDVKVDTTGSDCSRACFLSHDPDPVYNVNSTLINVDDYLALPENTSHDADALAATPSVSVDPELSGVIQFLIQKNNETGLIYNNYKNWQISGLALASLGEEGREYFLRLSFGNLNYHDTEQYVNSEYDKLLRIYGNNSGKPVTIATLYSQARLHGYTGAGTFPMHIKFDDEQFDDEEIAKLLHQEGMMHESEFSSSYTDPYWERLGYIAKMTKEVERERALKLLAAEQKASVSAVKTDLKKVKSNSKVIEFTEKCSVVHPALHVQSEFLLIGFRVMVIVDKKLQGKDVFLIGDSNGQYHLTEESAPIVNDMQLVIDTRNRVLPRLEDRWSHNAMMDFIEHGEPPKHVFKRLKAVIRDHIEFQKDAHYGLIAAWIISTYFHRCFFAFPYLFFFGKKQTAKTRAMQLLKLLSFNAVKGATTSHAAFIDTVDNLRGAFLTDQAESLSNPKYPESIGLHADSYTLDGGKKRLVVMNNGSRNVIEFDAFGPKAYAATKDIDPDLRDRCILISMIRANKEFPYPDGNQPIWGELRDSLYRLLLTKWKQALEIYPETGHGLTRRVRELWRPLETVLLIEEVPNEEIEAIKLVFCESMMETQEELSDRERILIDALLLLSEPAKTTPNGVSLSTHDIMNQMKLTAQGFNIDLGFETDKGYQTWIGQNLKRMSLATKREARTTSKGNRYVFHYDHVRDKAQRFRTVATVPGDSGVAA